ncbi:hypothetical protein ATE59_11790 [Sphingopyxis sp. A083]|nr:hypothetical protein ATE59_11790 [Sphingopyxis sp. A083]
MNNPDDFPVDEAEIKAWLSERRTTTGMSWKAIEAESGIPSGTLSNWVNNTYAGKGENVARKVFRYRQMLDSQAERAADRQSAGLTDAPSYIETATGRRLRGLMTTAHSGEITYAATGPGTGKTKEAEQYIACVANAYMVTMKPTTKSVTAMMGEVIRALGGKSGTSWARQMSAQVVDMVKGRRTLLIVDEANYLEFEAHEELRAWHDIAGLGICLLGNEELHATRRSPSAASRPSAADAACRWRSSLPGGSCDGCTTGTGPLRTADRKGRPSRHRARGTEPFRCRSRHQEYRVHHRAEEGDDPGDYQPLLRHRPGTLERRCPSGQRSAARGDPPAPSRPLRGGIMSAAIKMIHVAKRELGMDDDDYRAVLGRATRGAATSLRAMTDGQLQLVIGEMKKLGFVPSSPTGTSRKVKGPFAPKLLALWLSGWNLGIVHSRDDQALIHFVERQTGIAHVQWLRDPRDAAKAIDGLKLWIAREAGVIWPKSTVATGREMKVAVIAAQHRLLGLGEHYRDSAEVSDAQLDKIIGALGAKIRGAKNG